MTITIPTWTRDFVTATAENDNGQTVTRYTGWRAVLDPTCMQRYSTCDEWDLGIFADDGLHGPGQCGTDCHRPDDGSMMGTFAGSVPDGDQGDVIDEAVTVLAEQGFRIDGPWIPGPNGTLTAPLVPVILDPTCAVYEPETASAIGAPLTKGERVEVEDADARPDRFPRGVVVEQPADGFTPNDGELRVWVKFDGTGDVCPIREWRVRRLTASRR
jgi:hypothetical protein